MIRLLACLALLIGIAPALAQVQLPPGADPQNTLLIDTKYGRIVLNPPAGSARRSPQAAKRAAHRINIREREPPKYLTESRNGVIQTERSRVVVISKRKDATIGSQKFHGVRESLVRCHQYISQRRAKRSQRG